MSLLQAQLVDLKLPIKIAEGEEWPGEVRLGSHVRRVREP
jgi:hypothetical protein